MIADLKPYADYKETGLLWLGKVPRHWEIKRGKSYLTIVDERSREGREELLTVSSARGVVPRRTASVTMFKAKSYAGHKLCWPGDLVINSLWAWGGGLGVSRHHGIISTAYSVYRSRPSSGMDPRFLHELVRSAAFQWELQVRSKGVWISRLQLTDTAFLDAPIPLPPPAEQAAIVRFLDWANGRLERAIRAKRKVIALLNEQKQAIIHRAVTRGLDPSVPLKPSGIPWLGDIPAHWQVRRLKSILTRNDGGVWGSDFTPNGTVVLRSTEQSMDGSWKIHEPAVIRLSEAQVQSALLEAGDIVITKSSGSATHIGKASLVTREVATMRCCYSNFMQRVRSNQEVAPEYLSLFLNSKTGRIHYQYASTSTTGLGNLTRETIFTLPIPLPDRVEQVKVLDGVRLQLLPVEDASFRLEREIDLLREYRTRLVADVVTGKLDVRAAATQIPDETQLNVYLDSPDIGTDAESLESEEVA